MTYSVRYSSQVGKFLDRLDKHISGRIKKRLALLTENPYRYLEHFAGDDYHKLRVGEYRALVDVDENTKIVWIRVLGHRRDIYKHAF